MKLGNGKKVEECEGPPRKVKDTGSRKSSAADIRMERRVSQTRLPGGALQTPSPDTTVSEKTQAKHTKVKTNGSNKK